MKRLVRAASPEIVKIAGDSSSSSVETSFRELDDVFLQTQTRIWLGEVLHIRFDEETTITDLLADGELLFQVSKKVWKMLLKKHVELKHSKMYIYDRTSSGKSDGRYMPYPKVDSFLKICRILGLTGIDLFSPSDIVDKRDARRVCMCIRSFSKKARSKNLNVPDFDIVTYAIAMPTDLVGGIRRNLEQSQCSSSSSNGCTSPSTDLREWHRQKRHDGQNFQHCDSHSEFNEAESAFTELEFQSPLSNGSCDVSNVSGQHSPEGNLGDIGDLSESQTLFRLDTLEEVENADKRRIQNGSHELKDAPHSNSSLSHTECQMGVEKAMPPLRNPGNVVDINNVDISAYQNFPSTYAYSLHDLDELHTDEAKEDFELFGPTLRRKGLDIDFPIYSFTNESKISCNEDDYTLKDHVDVEINSDERVRNPVMPLMDEDMLGTDQQVRESKTCKSTAFDVSEIRLMDGHAERAKKVKVSTEKVSTEDGSSLDDLSTPTTSDIYSVKENDEANDDGRRKQEPEEGNEELMTKLDSEKKAEARATGNIVLKSVVGTLTLLGAIFVVHHIRQKRTKDENTEFIVPRQNQKPNQDFPAQKRVEIPKPKPDPVPADKRYPGERLKF